MNRKFKIIIVLAIFCSFAQNLCAAENPELTSASTARCFYELGRSLYNTEDADFIKARQGLVFFDAAMSLDSNADYILPDVIEIAWKYPQENYAQMVKTALGHYVNINCDLEVVSKGVSYLLERQNSREQREQVLKELIGKYEGLNDYLVSDLFTRLGMLRVETADFLTARQYFAQAYSLNKYNLSAFEKLSQTALELEEPLADYLYLQNMRIAVTVNPLDFDSAFEFGQYCDSLGLYEPAQQAYRYCADVDNYLSGTKILQPGLYLPWVLSSYNAGMYRRCLEIIEHLRDQNDFDVMTEAIAAACAMQTGDQNSLSAILEKIESRGDKILSGKLESNQTEYERYAWFYAFLSDADSEKILQWAKKAYEADANSVNSASLYAYGLVVNSKNEQARQVLDQIQSRTQISAFARARLLALENEQKAIELLNSAIAAAPGTFEAKKANDFLKTLGVEYEHFIDPKVFTTALKSDFGKNIFNEFKPPKDMLELKFNTKGSVFSFGSKIKGSLAIINKRSEPLIINNKSFFTGSVRVDAVLSGDVSMEVPAVVTKTLRPSKAIRGGDAFFIDFDLLSGKLLKTLNCCMPQADVKIKYTVYIDPVVNGNGKVNNAFGIIPAQAEVKRRGVDINTRYLQQRLDVLNQGQQGQKIKSAELFSALLTEQQRIAKTGKTPYRLKFAEPELLSSAVARCISEDDWVTKTQSIAAAADVKNNWRLTRAISAEMDNSHWPVRLISLYVLSRTTDNDFDKVLKWSAEYEQNQIVKSMAQLLLARRSGSD